MDGNHGAARRPWTEGERIRKLCVFVVNVPMCCDLNQTRWGAQVRAGTICGSTTLPASRANRAAHTRTLQVRDAYLVRTLTPASGHVNLLPWQEGEEARSLKPLLGVKQLTVTDRGRNNLDQTLQLPRLEQLAVEVDDYRTDVDLAWLKSLSTSTSLSLSLTIDGPANAGRSILPHMKTLRALSMRKLTASDRMALQKHAEECIAIDRRHGGGPSRIGELRLVPVKSRGRLVYRRTRLECWREVARVVRCALRRVFGLRGQLACTHRHLIVNNIREAAALFPG